jgi:hypothetical protein
MLSLLTSATGLLVGRKAFGLSAESLRPALLRAGEILGAALLFWTANILLGATLALSVRGLGLGFVSIYVNTDLTLGLLSLMQALVFETWRERGSATSGARA